MEREHDKYCELGICQEFDGQECPHDLDSCLCTCSTVQMIRTATVDIVAERVREIHTKSPDTITKLDYWRGDDLPKGEFYYCENCSDFEYTLEPYPCPTLRAVYGK